MHTISCAAANARLLHDGSFRLESNELSVIAICHNFHQLTTRKPWSMLVVSFDGQMGTPKADGLFLDRYPQNGSERAI